MASRRRCTTTRNLHLRSLARLGDDIRQFRPMPIGALATWQGPYSSGRFHIECAESDEHLGHPGQIFFESLGSRGADCPALFDQQGIGWKLGRGGAHNDRPRRPAGVLVALLTAWWSWAEW